MATKSKKQPRCADLRPAFMALCRRAPALLELAHEIDAAATPAWTAPGKRRAQWMGYFAFRGWAEKLILIAIAAKLTHDEYYLARRYLDFCLIIDRAPEAQHCA